jgi:hypothetical protein
MNSASVILDPLLPLPVIAALIAASLGLVALALWRGLPGWALRGGVVVVVALALLQPSYQQEERAPLSDIVLMIEDQSASQRLGNRAQVTSQAADQLEKALQERPNTEVRRITVSDGDGDAGTQLMQALGDAMAQEPRGRIAGVFVLSDGRLHDADLAPDLPAPMHLLLSGEEDDWDRRLIIRNAPAFAILGEEIKLGLRVQDDGAAPGETTTQIEISVDGEPPVSYSIPLNRDLELPLTLPHGGLNVIRFEVPKAAGELTDRNNSALVQINGVRDRLRVLLVSGEPHAGGRTWRNLLKSDSSVDLVHFTILRPPAKSDGVPVSELSLIAFPTRELFLEKIHDFDLIIFDRYKRRGILPSAYLENVRSYVEQGGAGLVAAGPDFASADSIYRSPLAQILPAEPTARVLDEPYRPAITELGQRHPVTSGLPDPESWGRWVRQIEVSPNPDAQVLMQGLDERPLLVLDRAGKGRVALLASDHAWLWNRGFEGGGPQLELLRRLAHWMMKEPDLEEEALWAEASGQSLRIIRRSLTGEVGALTLTTPSGEKVELELVETTPGQFEAQYSGAEIGLYRLSEGDLNAVIGLGPATPREFEQTIASAELMQPLISPKQGGIARLQDGLPRLRDVREGRPASGRGWMGLTPRNAYETLDIQRLPLLPAWLAAILALGLTLGGWLREGQR